MKHKWIINVVDKIGFSCYDVVDIHEVIDLGNTYNLITGTGDIFLDKDYCNITENTIEYNTDYLNIYLEDISYSPGVDRVT